MRIATTIAALCTSLGLSAAAAVAVSAGESPVSVPLKAQGGSGETGTATLKDTAGGIVVTLHLDKSGAPQPAHIHAGPCASPNPNPKYRLANVVGGTSVTTIPKAKIRELAGKYSINVHRSTTDFAYVACGEVAK